MLFRSGLHLQVPTTHIESVLQVFAQAPQFFGSLLVVTQMPLQRVVPTPQTQALLTQLAPTPHCTPHAPQFCASLTVLTHTPLHSVVPAAQEHAPLVQTPAPHWMPQAPQFFTSVSGSMQSEPHSRWPAGQPQTPLVQASPAAQVLPQLPQLVTPEIGRAHV